MRTVCVRRDRCSTVATFATSLPFSGVSLLSSRHLSARITRVDWMIRSLLCILPGVEPGAFGSCAVTKPCDLSLAHFNASRGV